jgi:hypothetical protein
MANILHEYIKNYDDFLLSLKLQINNTSILLKKKYDDAKILNNDSKLLLKYFTKERKRLIKKIKIHHFILKVDINGFDFEIDKDDYNNLLSFIKIELFEENELQELKKENANYLTKYFNDLDKSIWIAFYNSKIEELKGVSIVGNQINTFNDLVFNNEISETFFNYMVENWLKEEPNKVTALQFVFSEMWYKTLEKETPYKIISTQPYFAREYWNKNYSNLLELHPKNPKLKKDNFIDYYHKRFKYFLTEFQGG